MGPIAGPARAKLNEAEGAEAKGTEAEKTEAERTEAELTGTANMPGLFCSVSIASVFIAFVSIASVLFASGSSYPSIILLSATVRLGHRPALRVRHGR
jgi:hypothetical protein